MTADVRDALDAIIDAAIANRPRALQTTVGPSDLGHECDRCLGHMLAGTPRLPEPEPPWLPQVGVCVHSWLQEEVTDHAVRTRIPGGELEWLCECRLEIGMVGGQLVTGTADLFHVPSGTSVDYKIVGKNTLTRVRRHGPSLQYRRQGHIYGLGWVRAGYTPRTIVVCYLPRNEIARKPGTFWHAEPYDEQVALDALARADAFALALAALGPDGFLPSLRRLPGCRDCKRYPAYPTDPPEPDPGRGQFADLVGATQ